VVKIFEQQDSKGISQLVPVLSSGRKLFPTPLVRQVAEFQDLMNKKHKHNQNQKIHREMLPTATLVVLDGAALVL